MAERRQGDAGKIASLFALLDEHEEALRADLMRMGWRLDAVGVDYSWLDLWAVVRYADHSTALHQSVHGHRWGMDTALLALLADQANLQLWLTSKINGGRGRKPKPLDRPAALRGNGADTKQLGKAADLDDIKAFLERKNGR